MFTLKFDDKIKAPDNTDYNDSPIGWKEISEQEFVRSKFFIYNFTMTENRQIYPDRSGAAYIGAILYWFHDKTGVAISSDYATGKVKYYSFGCEHKYQELSQSECQELNIYHAGRCYYVGKCKLCSDICAHDSSD